MLNKFTQCVGVLFLCGSVFGAAAQTPVQQKEQKVADYFASIQDDPLELLMFLRKMPKGADLHNHLDGAVYPENYIRYAHNNGEYIFCVQPDGSVINTESACPNKQLMLTDIQHNLDLYSRLLNTWSMRRFDPETTNNIQAHKHFFTSFEKFMELSWTQQGHMLAETVSRAGTNGVSYMEIMHTADADAAFTISQQVDWPEDFEPTEQAFEQLHEQYVAAGLPEVVALTEKRFTEHTQGMQDVLGCGSKNPAPGCQVKVRFLYQALRNMPPQITFAQLLNGFAVASQNPNVVGVNLVQAEDGYYSRKYHDLHMQMLAYLRKRYPEVNVALHAGELTLNLAPPEALQNAIRDAIDTGGAKRIGHGVSVAYEDDAKQLLQQMAEDETAVEINLTSNAILLGVTGKEHPLRLYLKHQVPVVLSTDDEGIFRTDITKEYQRAAYEHQLTYPELKQIARHGITYSFLPGASLWTDAKTATPVEACRNDVYQQVAAPGKACQNFLEASEKAQAQWQLEQEFMAFEEKLEG